MNIQGREQLYQDSIMLGGITIQVVVSPKYTKSKAINNKKRRELIEAK